MAAFIWPTRTWPLSTLTESQYSFWEANGYLVVPDAIPRALARDAAQAIRSYIGADDGDRSTWYKNTLDIYFDKLPDNKTKPHHGPCGMVQMFHHQAFWDVRQSPRLHAIFSDLYGTRRLFVTTDRAHFKPPENSSHPEWSKPGDVHVGLHWDIDTRRAAWPVPFVMQGVVYLEETTAEQGALRVVPGFHRRLESWDATQPADRGAERPAAGAAAAALEAQAVSVEGPAGALVVWHSLLPHGPAPNVAERPRISQYVSMVLIFHGRPPTFHGRPLTFHGLPLTFHGRPPTFHGRPPTFH